MVWVAGRDLFATVSDMTFLRDFALALGSARWALYGPGFRWRVGTIGDLQMTKRAIGARLRSKLYEFLGDPLEKSHGDAGRVFALYLRLDDEETVDRFLASGLYYFETHNREALELTRFRAVRASLFASDTDFDTRLSELQTWIKQNRLTAPAETKISEAWPLAVLLGRMGRGDHVAQWADLVDYSSLEDGEFGTKVLNHLVRGPEKQSPLPATWSDQ